MDPLQRVCIAITFLCTASLACFSKADDVARPQRIVCLGDSITDGHTYPLLVQQALKAAGKPVPVFINAGVGGDTADGMFPRLEADVIRRRPDLVLISVGINDFGRGVTLEQYRERVGKLIDALVGQKVKVMLLTTTAIRNSGAQAGLDQWNEALRQIAKERNLPIADVAAAFAPRVAANDDLWEADGCHLNFEGYRTMTRGVLDGLGYANVPVPDHQEITLRPGVVTPWKFRLAPDDKPLDESTVTAVVPDESWKLYTLPDTDEHESWWWNQERKRGFGIFLKQRVGEGERFQGVATLETPVAKKVFFQGGASLRTIWLNGKKIYQAPALAGWHIRQGVPAELKAGVNMILIETGGQFFVSMTDEAE